MFPRDLTFRIKISLIIVTVLIVILGNLFLLFLPQTKGVLMDDLKSSNVMSFEKINYTLQSGYHLDYSKGGFVVPIEDDNNPLGVVIYSKGIISYDDNSYNTDEAFIFLREDEYYEVMGNLLLYKSEEDFFINNANNSFPTILEQTSFLETPIGKKYYPHSGGNGHIIVSTDEEFINITDQKDGAIYNKPTFLLTSLIHILFTLAILFTIVIMTDRKPLEEPNRSLDSQEMSSKPLKVLLFTNLFWLGLLYLKANIYTVQIILMISLLYILYLLFIKNSVRFFDLRFINYSRNTIISLPITISIITFLLFGNTSITLQSINLNLTFRGMFFFITSLTWLFFISFSFIPFILSKFDKRNIEFIVIIIFYVLMYLAFSYIQIRTLNLYHFYNALVFIPIFATTLNIYSRRVYNFISPLLTVVLVRILIGIIK